MASHTLLREYTRMRLIEGRVEDVQRLYPDVDVPALAAKQPPGSNNKYLQWCAKQVAAGESPDIVATLVREFNDQRSRMERKDINQYSSVTDLQSSLPKRKVSKTQARNEVKKGADIIYDDDNYTVVRPNTTETSCIYGAGTRWCVAATSSKNYFKSYSSHNARFYYIINKNSASNDEWTKVAYVKVDRGNYTNNQVPDVDVYTATDRRIDVSELVRHMGESFEPIKAAIDAHDAQNNMSWEKILQSRNKVDVTKLQKIWKNLPEPERINLLSTNASLRPEDIARFAASKNYQYRAAIALRRDLTDEAIRKSFMNDEISEVRASMAARPDVSREEAEVLVNDKAPEVRFALLRNLRVPRDVIAKLTNDPVKIIALGATSLTSKK